jgi:hypothetical protein
MRRIDQPEKEFRRHPRYIFSGTLHLVGNYGARMNVADLSLSGVRFRSPFSLGSGLEVEMVFLAYNMTVKGTVRQENAGEAKNWQIGVEFDMPQPELLKVAIAMASHTN